MDKLELQICKSCQWRCQWQWHAQCAQDYVTPASAQHNVYTMPSRDTCWTPGERAATDVADAAAAPAHEEDAAEEERQLAVDVERLCWEGRDRSHVGYNVSMHVSSDFSVSYYSRQVEARGLVSLCASGQ